jgi:competence ComEA-like helix-hairpin-helix protein
VEALTPAERRGALVVVLLLALGAGHDLWRATRPLPRAEGAGAPTMARPEPQAPGDAPAPAAAGAVAERDPPALDLNRASARELDALPGIGPVLAARIVAHRQQHGPFGSREELLAVRGIGPRLLARLGGRIRVGGRAAPPPDTLAPPN